MNAEATEVPIDSCGKPTCSRPEGALLCERCLANLEALCRALEAEGIELKAQDQR